MAYDCWRGMVGIIKPTKGSSSLVDLIKMLSDCQALQQGRLPAKFEPLQ